MLPAHNVGTATGVDEELQTPPVEQKLVQAGPPDAAQDMQMRWMATLMSISRLGSANSLLCPAPALRSLLLTASLSLKSLPLKRYTPLPDYFLSPRGRSCVGFAVACGRCRCQEEDVRIADQPWITDDRRTSAIKLILKIDVEVP